MVAMLAVTACSDSFDLAQPGTENPLNHDKGIGQLVLFSSGNGGNSTTRASVIPYMEQDGRFVCKMYYHAKATDTDANDFDVETTPITSWLRVDDNEGNSVYWNRNFPDNNGDDKVDGNDLTPADREDANFKDYGFDPNAQFFYWRNRLDHIFLAYTDFNLLKSNQYKMGTDSKGNSVPVARSLFMYPEANGEKKTKTGQIETWPESSYTYRKLVFQTVYKPNPEYIQWETEHPGEVNPHNATIPVLEYLTEQSNSTYPVESGWHHFPLTSQSSYDGVSAEIIKATYDKALAIIDASNKLSDEDKAALTKDLERTKEHGPNEQTSEGTFRTARWWVGYDPTADGAIVDGAVNFAKSAVLYCRREKQKIEDVIATAPANVFDMRRTAGMMSMADQPDPLIAWTKMKPTGATQEANRVRLYFKHQFSQIQVNLTKGENTPELNAGNIVSVELLGVTEKGYVFTNINPDGTQIPPSYDAVVMSKYSEAQQKKNPHGTSFSMFEMTEKDKPQTSLKSFNAIAFGQLQAIRITWKEEPTNEIYTEETAKEENDKHLVENDGKKPGDDGYVAKYEDDYTPVTVGQEVPPVHHVATYKITVDERGQSLVNLKSGYRYVYDFELRRGTIAFIRAVIDGWQLSDQLNYGTSGTIAPDPTPVPTPDPTPGPTPQP